MAATAAAPPVAPPVPRASDLPPGPRMSAPRQALAWILRPEALLERARRECDEPFTIVLPLGPVVVVSDPADIKRVFTADPAMLRAGEGNAPLEPAVGPESLLLLDGPRHLRRRKLVLPPFHGERLARHAELIREIARADVSRWPSGEPFALEPRMRAITLEVILRIVFGIDDAGRLAELQRLYPELLPPGVGRITALIPALRHDLGPRSPWGAFVRTRARIDEILFDEIARRRADEGLGDRDDILSMLVAARDDVGEPLTDAELRDELMTLLLAGHETTATALSWAFELLHRHPAAMARVQAEARSDAEETPYLDAVCAETLRVKPPLPMVVRRLAEDFELAGRVLPAGTRLAPSIYLAHRRADVYPEPNAFRPERFLDEGVGGARSSYAWLPFGGGTRRCVGASFAQLEMQTVMREVLRESDLRPASARPERTARRAIVLAPEHGAMSIRG
jgi:cytochrome P450